MAGEENVSLRLTVTAEGIEVVDHTGKKLATLKREAEDLGKSGAAGFSTFQTAVIAANQALELAGRVARSVKGVYEEVTQAAIEQQNASAALAQTLRSTGQYTPTYVRELEGISTAYQRTTRYADEVVLGVEKQLVAFGATRGQVNQLTGAVLDLSEGMGKDLSGATLLLGKALAGEFATLARYGIFVDDNASRSVKLAQAVQQINERFGGQASAAAQTYGGRIDQLGNAFGELRESIGFILVGSDASTSRLGQLTERVLGVADAVGDWTAKNRGLIDSKINAFFDELSGAADELLPKLPGIASDLASISGSAASAAVGIGQLAPSLHDVSEGISELREVFSALPEPLQQMLLGAAVGAVVSKGSPTAIGAGGFAGLSKSLLGNAIERSRGVSEAVSAMWDNLHGIPTVAGIPNGVASRTPYVPPQSLNQITGLDLTSIGQGGFGSGSVLRPGYLPEQPGFGTVLRDTGPPQHKSSAELEAERKAAETAAKGLIEQRKQEFELAKATGATLLELQQKLSLEQQAELATAKSAGEQEGIRVKYRHELLDLTYEFKQVELQNKANFGDAQITRDQTGLTLAQDRLAVAQATNRPTSELLAIGAEIESQQHRLVDQQIVGLENDRQKIDAALAAKKITDDTAISERAKLDAQEDSLRVLEQTQHTVDDIRRGSQIDLGGSIQDVITGTGLGTGNLGDSVKRAGQSIGSKLFSGMLEEKLKFDGHISKNFLNDIPGFFESGANTIADTWSSVLGGLGVETDRVTTGIAGSFQDAFKDVSSSATDTAQNLGSTLGNIPGIGNISAVASNLGSIDSSGADIGKQASEGLAFTSQDQMSPAQPMGFEGQANPQTGVDAGALSSGLAAGATSFGIGFGIQMLQVGLAENARLRNIPFLTPEQRKQLAINEVDPIQGGIFKTLGIHNTNAQSAISGLLTAGWTQVLTMILGVHQPTGEGLIGKQLGDILNKAQIPITYAAGGQTGSSHPYQPGNTDHYYPQVPLPESYAGIDRTPLATLLQSYFAPALGSTTRISGYDITEGPAQQLLNVSAGLGLSEEDAKKSLSKVVTTIGGNFDAAVLELRRFQKDTVSGRTGVKFGEDDADGVKFFTLSVEELITAFGDLPPAVDAGRLSVLALGEDGTLELEALNRQIATAKRTAQDLDLGGAFRAGVAGGYYGGQTFQRQLNQNARTSFANTITEQIGASAPAGEAFQAATATIAKAGEAFRQGDLEKGNELIAQARDEWEAATDAEGDYLNQLNERAPEYAALLKEIRISDLTDQYKADFGGALAGAVTGGLDSKDFKRQVTQSLQQNVGDALTGAFVGQFPGFNDLSANLAAGVASIEQGDVAGARGIFAQINQDLNAAIDSAGNFFDYLKEQFPELADLVDNIHLRSLVPSLEAGADSTREEVDQIHLRGLKPKQREAEIRSRLAANQAELDALKASPGGIDTAEEFQRAGELANERKGFYEDLLSVADERFADGSRREKAAFAEVERGLTSVADFLDGLAVGAESQADKGSPQWIADQIAAGAISVGEGQKELNDYFAARKEANAPIENNSAAVVDNTSAVLGNTDALTKMGEAMLAMANSADGQTLDVVGAALKPVFLLLVQDEGVRAALKKITTQG